MDHPPNHERTYCCQLMLDCYDFLVNMSNMVGWHNMIFKPTPYFFWVFHARSHRACDFCYKKKANHAMTWCFPTTEPTSSWKSGWPDVIRCPNGWLNGGNHGETMVYPAFWCILHTHWMDMAVQTSPGSFRKDEVTPRTLLGQPEEIIKDRRLRGILSLKRLLCPWDSSADLLLWFYDDASLLLGASVSGHEDGGSGGLSVQNSLGPQAHVM